MRTARTVTAALLLGLLAGCGDGGLAPVAGTVTYKGQPLKEGTIVFHTAKGRPAHGRVKDGQIVEVTTVTLGDGVAVGPARVTVQAVTNAGDMYAKHTALVPNSYGDPDKSGLSADIKGGPNALTFELK